MVVVAYIMTPYKVHGAPLTITRHPSQKKITNVPTFLSDVIRKDIPGNDPRNFSHNDSQRAPLDLGRFVYPEASVNEIVRGQKG